MRKKWDMNKGMEFTEFSTFEKILMTALALLIASVILAQTYRAGQRNGENSAIGKAQAVAYDSGFQACQEQF